MPFKRSPLIINFNQVHRVNGKTVIVESLLMLLFGLSLSLSVSQYVFLTIAFFGAVVFAYAFYFTNYGTQHAQKFFFVPYLLFPLAIIITSIIVPQFAPYVLFLYFILTTSYVVIFGTKLVKYYLSLVIILITYYVFAMTDFSILQKIALNFWLCGSLILISFRDSFFARELFGQRNEVRQMTKLTSDLQLAWQRNEALLHNIHDGVIAIDEQNTITLFNKAAEYITGFSQNEIKGKTIHEFLRLAKIRDNELYDQLDPSHTARHTNEPIEVESLALANRENKPMFVDMTFVPVGFTRDPQHESFGYIVTIKDVTKEKDLETMKLDFVSMAAHELRTPITAIRGYVSLLQEEIGEQLDEEHQTFLKRVDISTQQLMALTENLLSVSRIERGNFTLERKTINWELLLQETVDRFAPNAHEKGLKLKHVPAEKELPEISVDPLRITEVLNNLIANAINYTEQGSVTVSAEFNKPRDEIITHISDTGVGIPEDAQKKLFTKFYRVTGILQQGSKGTGLGLYISKNIVELHGGKIWVESDGTNGTTFSFSLPIKEHLEQ